MILNSHGRRIHFDLLGDPADPVVCLLHSLSSDSGIWSEQVPALLAGRWRVLRIDMRGHGGSEAGAGNYTMSGLSNDVAAVLDFLGLDRVHLVGLSIGGMIAQTFALEQSHRLRALVLCGTSPQAVPGGMAMWNARFQAVEEAGSLDPIADATMTRWFTDRFRSARPDRWKQVRSTIASTSPAGYRGGAEAIIAFDVAAKLPAVRAATLVICGDEDTGTPPAGNIEIARLIPGALYEEMPNARHIPMMEYPDAFNRILLPFLEGRG